MESFCRKTPEGTADSAYRLNQPVTEPEKPKTPDPATVRDLGFYSNWPKFSLEFYKNVEKCRRLLTRQESGHIIAMETETKKDIEIYFHFAYYFLFLTISLLLKYYVEGYREVSGTDRIK